MKRKKAVLTAYIMVFAACLWSAADRFSPASGDGYRGRMEKLSYQIGFPDAYSPVFSEYAGEEARETANTRPGQKTVYLTFDDGPSPRTPEILDILKKYDIKATFFVVKGDEKYSEYLARAASEGHSVGVHSSSHSYHRIYGSVAAFLRDFSECRKYIEEVTGLKPTILRFPGGSVNSYNASVRRELTEEMVRRGYVYFDWNVESGDGTGKLSARTIYENVVNGCRGKQRAIVIMHDAAGKDTTVRALEDIITTLKDDGWRFAPLDNTVRPMVFRMK